MISSSPCTGEPIARESAPDFLILVLQPAHAGFFT
jgi:hypothetical protein